MSDTAEHAGCLARAGLGAPAEMAERWTHASWPPFAELRWAVAKHASSERIRQQGAQRPAKGG
ncbi:hypothetical protein GCM10009527_092390 [Actinomadura nitritigenes]